ncbi:MAG: YjbQ family protein [Deltaproteobacteria bacterium]|nr:YjbQ family protein [Deltaproteobacteria bacterium]MCL4873307.1 secondary thiamine-phosphate synthase enzyme YjbQ [bacterium]
MTFSSHIDISSRGFADIIDITSRVEAALNESGMRDGIVSVFVVGSTASITTIEYEKGVIEDLKDAIERMAPMGIPYKHDSRWGDGNGFAHVRAALLKPGITIPVIGGSMVLGTWQQVVLIDFDNRPRNRRVVVQATGER